MIKYLLVLTLLISQSVYADGISTLKDFFLNTNTMRANFKQVVVDKDARKIQEVEGKMLLKRPNKFRWDYNKPYEQQIISDGHEVYLYDIDLQQVTVRSLGKALGASPAAMLAGGEAVEKNFTLKNAVRKDNLTWVLALPKTPESGFERILLGFNQDKLVKMELYDSFSNVTHITYNNIAQNPALADSTFLFTPPNNVDVVGE
jgi:outer membrane lipoprotein carrier protein